MGGAAVFFGLGILIAWLAQRPRRFAIGRLELDLPPARFAVLLMIVGAGEMAAAIGALFVLLPTDVLPSFPMFSVGYIGAVTLGLGSQAPGGLGIFEAAMIAVLSGTARGDILAALLTYRLIYNIVPFALSAVALACIAGGRPSSKVDNGE